MGIYISPDIVTGTYVRARLIVEYSANASSNNNSCTAYVQMWRTNADYTGSSSGSGTIYIKTEDDSSWWTSSVTDSQKVSYNSYTLMGSKRSLTISNDKTGRRTIKFYVKATNNATDNLAFDQQTFSVTLAPCPVYSLSISAGTGSSITVDRTSSAGNSTGKMTAGSKKLYYGDRLKITFTPSANYNITTHTVNDKAFTSGSTHSVSADVAVKATATPLKSLVAATDANIESVSTIIITRYNNAYTHTLKYTFGDLTGTIATKTSDTTIAWTVPKSFYAEMPTTERACVITCTTYNGSTSLGSTECALEITTSKKLCAPTVSVTAADSNENTVALTGDNKKIIRYHSNVEVTATVEPKNSAKITKTTLKCGAATASGTSNTFTNAESIDISATATDSRGYETTAEATGLTLIKYIKLTTNTTAKRTSPTSNEVTITTKGNYFNGSFGAVSNTLKAQVRYKPQSQSAYTDADSYANMTVTISGNTYTATATLTGLDYTQAYDIRVRVQDKVYEYNGALADAVYNNIKLSKGIPVFDWGENDVQFNVPARFRATGDADEATNAKVAIRTGPDDGQHIDIDTNEILAKEDETTLGDLSLGGSGVYVNVNGSRAFKCDADGNQSAQPLTVSQGGFAVGGQTTNTKIYAGKVLITPTAENTPTGVYVEFPSGYFSSEPFTAVSPRTTVPERCPCGYYPDGTKGVTIYMTRTNTTANYVSFICIGV